MTRLQAKIFIVGGLLLAAGGWLVSEPSVPNFWLWLALPGIMVVGGIIRLMRK
jgi:hypothetical protein